MIYVSMNVGSFHGWGVCGRYLTKELNEIEPVSLTPDDPFSVELMTSELEYRFFTRLINPHVPLKPEVPHLWRTEEPLLQAVRDNRYFRPMMPHFTGKPTVGYTFFENDLLEPEAIDYIRQYYDLLVCGSTWCHTRLKEYGLTNTMPIIQGIDPDIFYPNQMPKHYFRDQFIIFSGGKFEFRKGQDLVIRAFKVLQDRYPDVMLLTSWYNAWKGSFDTMKSSSFIQFQPPTSGECLGWLKQVLVNNGIDLNRVVLLPHLPNAVMAGLYRNADVGIFPNRCEGGTNLVMMEFMACGKPVVAAYNTGHRDILTENNSCMIRGMRPFVLMDETGKRPTAYWQHPDLEEIIAALDWAYHHRDDLARMGHQAGEDLKQHTWKKVAARFYQVLRGNNP